MSKIRALQWIFKQRPPPPNLSPQWHSSGCRQSARKTPRPCLYARRVQTLVNRATDAYTLVPSPEMTNGSRKDRNKALLSLISLPFYKSATWAIKGENEWTESESCALVYCFREFAGKEAAIVWWWEWPLWRRELTLAEELIQTFIRMHTSTHCHSIYSLTLGKQINCVINKFSWCLVLRCVRIGVPPRRLNDS